MIQNPVVSGSGGGITSASIKKFFDDNGEKYGIPSGTSSFSATVISGAPIVGYYWVPNSGRPDEWMMISEEVSEHIHLQVPSYDFDLSLSETGEFILEIYFPGTLYTIGMQFSGMS